MKIWRVLTLILFITFCLSVSSYAQDNSVQSQIKALQGQIQLLRGQSQKQIDALQEQVNAMQKQLAQQDKEKQELKAQLAQKVETPPLISWGKTYRMRKEEGLENESPVNISGEVAIQYKTQTRSGSASS